MAVLPSTYRSTTTRCITRAALYFKSVPCTFQCNMKAIAIGISRTSLWLKSVIVVMTCVVHLHVFFPEKAQNRYNQLSPNTNFYMALYPLLSVINLQESLLRVLILFEIDDDNGTVVTGILSHLETKLHRNHTLISISSISIGPLCQLITSLYIALLYLFPSQKYG